MSLAFLKQIFAIIERAAPQEEASCQEEAFEEANCDIFHEVPPLAKRDRP